MKNIQEGAKEYADKHKAAELEHFGVRNFPYGRIYNAEMTAYEKGAAEQKAIDIEKAKTAFSKACGWLSTYPWYNAVLEEFIKNIEE